jgi:DNA-binding transcriptional regulator YiaG
MGKIESIIKSEILRLAKRQLRTEFLPLRREVRGMRLKLSSLSKGFGVLDRQAKEQQQQEAKTRKIEASPEELKKARLTPQRIKKLRQKLGISQRELGILTKVNPLTVGFWEKGKFKPKPDKRAILVGLRKMRKRDVKKLLAESKPNEKPEKLKPQKRKALKPRRKK